MPFAGESSKQQKVHADTQPDFGPPRWTRLDPAVTDAIMRGTRADARVDSLSTGRSAMDEGLVDHLFEVELSKDGELRL